MEPKDVAVMLVLLAAFATAGWVMYLAAETSKRQRRMKAQAELHGRLLDKFGSAHEVVEFLQTPGGAQFVDGISERPGGAVERDPTLDASRDHPGDRGGGLSVPELVLSRSRRESAAGDWGDSAVPGRRLSGFGRGVAPPVADVGPVERSGNTQ